VRHRWEGLGGKGAKQAVALAQLDVDVDVAVVAVVGDGPAGDAALAQARDDGLDVSLVVRREAVATALLVDVVAGDGTRRLLEDVPEASLLRAGDVGPARSALGGAQVVSLQLQQPPDALRAVLDAVPEGVLVVADGGPGDDDLRELLLQRGAVPRLTRRRRPRSWGTSLRARTTRPRPREVWWPRGRGWCL
jgi:ribokinase